MLDFPALAACLDEIGLSHWNVELLPLLRERLSGRTHGDWARWSAAVEALPGARGDTARTRELLMELHPWRKGPLELDDVRIDTEWRSDWKWARVRDALAPLAGRRVLDVGSGNGYYALEMRKAGAAVVIGVDPTLLFVMQFLAINVFARDPAIFILPCRLEETPPAQGVFDTTFSMGVLYHQRDPLEHLQRLGSTLRPGGQLVLETLFLPGEDLRSETPPNRYARMRNVWSLPTVPQLTSWLRETGFNDIDVVDTSVTSTGEQRRTEWMTFESLQEALDPDDPSRTIEGWPAPRRVVVTATTT
ncbi:MAG: tRNA 5-methoxyuridine(34)/uridine 5-oxyacetic acid(34) synthase CmoB [Woeseiaceae bacterium]